jgi:serine/threonine protein kinase
MSARRSSRTLVEAETLVGPSDADACTRSGAQPLVLGPYLVRELVGEGAMGRVYRATDSRSGRELAVKQIKTRFSRDRKVMTRFLREAEAVSRLSHPGLVAIHGTGDDYIAMELVRGHSLEARLESWTLVPPPQALRILEEVAQALDYIHAKGVVHRDVKPSNLLLSAAGGVKITDFGIAHLSWAPLTRSGEVLGTPAYMAPEQITTGDVSPATDVYALGLVAFEMLTGARAFKGRSYAELLMRVIDKRPASAHACNPLLPPDVDAVMEGVLAKDPDERFTSATAFVGALRSALGVAESPLVRAARRLATGARSLLGRP